jgi:hypothetical protein
MNLHSCFHNGIIDINLISDTAAPQLLPKAEDIWKCNEGSNRRLIAEEEKTRSCLKCIDLDAQAHGDSREVCMLQNTDTESRLCAPGDVDEVQTAVMTVTYEMLSKAEERWAPLQLGQLKIMARVLNLPKSIVRPLECWE